MGFTILPTMTQQRDERKNPMRYEVPKTPPELSPRDADEVVVVLRYPKNTELLKLHDEMDQIDRRLVRKSDGTYEAVRRAGS
jgi:hypothetical protein